MDARQLARLGRISLAGVAAASLAACASVQPRYAINAPRTASRGPTGYKVGAPYQVGGIWYVPREQPNYDKVGVASWYGDQFNDKLTADGEIFDMNAVSGAHTTLPLPCIVEVTNLDNGRKLRVRVNDRGPFVGGRIIDLSHEAARELGYDRQGLAHVRVRYIGPAPLLGPEAGVQIAKISPRPDRPEPIQVASARPSRRAPAWSAATGAAASVVSDGASASPEGAVFAAPPLEPVSVAAKPLAPLTGAALGTPRPPEPPPAEPPPAGADSIALASAAIPSGAPPADGSVAATDPAPAAPRQAAAADAPPTGFRIQAGAFANRVNAERAVSELSSAGQAVIEPIEHDGATLFRVVLPAPADQAQADALRDRVAAIGFADARVVQPF